MKTDKNGCSTTANGTENSEKFYSSVLKKYLYQYDYRTPEGQLFTCTGKTLEICRTKRDTWLNQQTA